MATTEGPRRHSGLEIRPARRRVLEGGRPASGRPRRLRRDAGPRGRASSSSGVKNGPHSLRAGRAAEEVLGRAPRGALRLQRPEAVGAAGACGVVAVRRDPQPALASTAQLSGIPNQPFLVVADEKVAPTAATDGSPQRTSISHGSVSAAWSPPSGDHLDDVAERVVGARVGRVDLLGLAAGVVGQHDVDLVRLRVGLDVLRPVHLRRAEKVGGAAGLDQHVGLARKAVRRGQRALAMHQRHPVAGAVRRCTWRRRACRRRGGRYWRPGCCGRQCRLGDELVDVVEALVVAADRRHSGRPVDDHRRALVLDAAKRRALLRHRVRVERIDLHHPAEAVGLVRLLAEVEAVVELAPGEDRRRRRRSACGCAVSDGPRAACPRNSR